MIEWIEDREDEINVTLVRYRSAVATQAAWMPAPEDGRWPRKQNQRRAGRVVVLAVIDIRALGGREGNWVRWIDFIRIRVLPKPSSECRDTVTAIDLQ